MKRYTCYKYAVNCGSFRFVEVLFRWDGGSNSAIAVAVFTAESVSAFVLFMLASMKSGYK
jgi:hypothetical protein